MKRLSLWVLCAAFATPAMAGTYVNDFEGDAIGTLPAGWTTVGWGDWAPGPINATVEAAPTGGQALKLSWGTDWNSYGASSGEVDYTFDTTGLDLANTTFHYEFDFYKSNWRVWQAAGDQTWFPPAGIHMNDDPNNPNKMVVGTDDYSQTANLLTDVPENVWVHVVMDFNAATDEWQAAIGYAGGSGGGTFSGTSTNDVFGQFFFGGWAFQSTMDQNGGVPYENYVYLDNINFSVGAVPEPATMAVLGLGVLGVLARRRRK